MFRNPVIHIPDLLIQLEAAAFHEAGLETMIESVLQFDFDVLQNSVRGHAILYPVCYVRDLGFIHHSVWIGSIYKRFVQDCN